jgi:hypothetical protein
MPKETRRAEPTGTAIALRVVEATAETLGTDPRKLDPLYESVEPDALATVVETAGRNASLVVRFEYVSCVVEVSGTGEVAVERSG